MTPTPTRPPHPTATATPVATTVSRAPFDGYMLDRVGMALGIFGKVRSDSGKHAVFLAENEENYEDLNRRLDDVLGIPKKEPTRGEKVGAVVGQAVGYSCAAIAAAQALDKALGKKKKGK